VGRELQDRYSKSYISLFKFSDSEKHMRHIVRFVEARAALFTPFNVFLKDFGVFYNGSKRTIYMDVVNKFYIQDIFEKLVKEGTAYTPHIPIARNLDEEEYLRCWPYLKSLHYSNQHFLCDRITVLGRTDAKWIPVREIHFGGAA
jgi:2'-5' RNA ligase